MEPCWVGEYRRAAPTYHAASTVLPPRSLRPVMALQVAGGVGCCICLSLLGLRQVAVVFLPPLAMVSDGAAVEDGDKTVLGGSGVAGTKFGIGDWSWGDTTYGKEFRWDGMTSDKFRKLAKKVCHKKATKSRGRGGHCNKVCSTTMEVCPGKCSFCTQEFTSPPPRFLGRFIPTPLAGD